MMDCLGTGWLCRFRKLQYRSKWNQTSPLFEQSCGYTSAGYLISRLISSLVNKTLSLRQNTKCLHANSRLLDFICDHLRQELDFVNELQNSIRTAEFVAGD